MCVEIRGVKTELLVHGLGEAFHTDRHQQKREDDQDH